MKEILDKLINKGFDAYIVGGYVRDYLLNVNSFDIDICTNANIDNIVKILGEGGKVYREYFSYHIKEGLYNYDITTFRKELEYKNNKPIKIIGVNELYTDLLRRDFTINTLVLDKHNNLIDLLGGRKDLDNKIIKTVGNAYDRFNEDKTRILRAIRFSCTLDFDLDNEIKLFLKEKGYLIEELNSEYVKNELDKIFITNPIKFFNLIEEFNLKKYFKIDYSDIIKTPDYYGIWAQVENEYNHKKEDKSIINIIRKLINNKSITPYDIYKYGETISLDAASVLEIDISEMINKLPIRNVLDIDITFDELSKYKDKYNLNEIINNIEKNILNNKLKNNKYDIIKYIEGEYHE